jgi:DNA-binding response OmpR family regulator
MKKILLADDEVDILGALGNILTRNNYEVISTDKGKEVVKLANNSQPDAIILDLLMPDMDGTEVAAMLERYSTTKDIPIIFLTGTLTKGEEMPGKKTGKRHYALAKPVSSEELLKVVESALQKEE